MPGVKVVSERKTTREMRRYLKLATRNEIDACGGLEAAASWTRVGKTELGYYQSDSYPHRFMPIDVVADLTLANGTCAIVGELTSLVECACVPSPRNSTSLCAAFKTLGDYVSSVYSDFPALLGSDKLDRRQIERLDNDLGLVISAAMDARAALRELSAGETMSSLPCANGGAADDA